MKRCCGLINEVLDVDTISESKVNVAMVIADCFRGCEREVGLELELGYCWSGKLEEIMIERMSSRGRRQYPSAV